MEKSKPNPIEAIKAAREQLQAAIKAGELFEARLNTLRIRATALEAETQEAIDPLDRQSVTKRAECLAQKAAVENELLNAKTIRAETAETILAALQACSGPVKEIVNQQAQTMSKRLEEFLAPFCKDRGKAAHVAGLCDALQYLNAASTCWWSCASNVQTAKWVLANLVERLLSERPTLWPAPPKLVCDSASMA